MLMLAALRYISSDDELQMEPVGDPFHPHQGKVARPKGIMDESPSIIHFFDANIHNLFLQDLKLFFESRSH